MNNHFYQTFLTLRRLSWYYRLLLVLSSFAILEVPVLYLIAIGKDRSVASILFFSGVLAAILFPWKKACTLQTALLLSHVTVLVFMKGYGYPSVPTIFAAITINFLIIWTVGCLSHGWEMAKNAAEQQKNLSLMKDQFISNVNHEMRNPLIGAIGALDLLKDKSVDLTEQEREQFLDQAICACDELQRIAGNILDAIRVDSDVSPPWIKEFDLSLTISDVLCHVDALGHALSVDIPDSIIVRGDFQQVSQVVRNLLSNAFKYAPKDSPVIVRVWQNDEFAYVCVQDRGPGIAPDQMPLIFQKFSRLECNLAGPVHGIGLGLYICRRFIENMGGHIWVESTGVQGEGSNFCFTVPCVCTKL
jgi:signal transduction histidine kinase